MKTAEELKTLVKEKYGQIATQSKEANQASCCGVDCCDTVDYSVFAEDYSQLQGYLESADLALGCGIPVEHANMQPGNTVVDLGSGAGNDAFVARSIVGETGQVTGIDMTDSMIQLARENKAKLGFNNVEFLHGDIENIPLETGFADVVISNCVLNLVPDKQKAYQEVHRILKAGGHFCISDVVIKGDLPDKLRNAAEMYAGCVSGAMDHGAYLGVIHEAGFQQVSVKALKEISIPDETLTNYLSPEEIQQFKDSDTGIFSITVYAEKACCEPGKCC